MAAERWVLLGHVDQQYVAEMIRETLHSRGIPVDVKSREAGAYLQIYMGVSFMGFDLYVPSGRLEEAKQFSILNSGEALEVNANKVDIFSEQSQIKRTKKLKLIFAAIIVIMLLLGILVECNMLF